MWAPTVRVQRGPFETARCASKETPQVGSISLLRPVGPHAMQHGDYSAAHLDQAALPVAALVRTRSSTSQSRTCSRDKS